ncbi:PAS domain S-box protein [Pseudomonas lalucatii]|nr:PAS domain S-box protein [Pseudomonas lalucatii]
MEPDSFAFRLKELLELKKLSLQAVASALGISRTAVHKWTRGGAIDDERLRSLAAFLDVNWIWLRYGEQAQQEAESAGTLQLPMTDVRRQYAAEIMESEARMLLALENARIVTWEWNLLSDEVTYSHNVQKIYGWQVNRNEDFWPHVVPEDAASLRATIDQAIATGEPYDLDFRIVLGSGEVRWISSRATPIRDGQGRVLRMTGVSTDTTERKIAEEALRESEARFRTIFEQACGAMAYIALDGTWLKVNQRLCALLGYAGEELCGQRFQLLGHADELPHNLALLERLKSGEIDMYEIEKRMRHRDGHFIWIRARTSLQRDPDSGEAEHLITFLEDITAQRTERERLLAQLAHCQQQLATLTAGGRDS